MSGPVQAVRRLGTAVPAGTLPVAAGLGVLGLAAYGYLAIAGHQLSPRGYADLAVLWMIVFSVGPGLFFPLEQELSRLLAAQRARGRDPRPVTVRLAVLGGTVLLALLAVSYPLRDWLATELFSGDSRLVGVLAANLVALTAAHLSRGLLSGSGHFGRYGVQLGLDGLLRCLLAAALAVTGVADPAWYGLVLAVAPLLAVAVTVVRPRPSSPPDGDRPADRVGYRGLATGIALLVASSTLWLAVVNAAVVSARLLAGPGEAALAGALLSAVVLARVPLFVFSSVQASLLPALSRAAATGDRAGFQRLLLRTIGAVAALGAVGMAVCVVAGPWLAAILFGAGGGAGAGAGWGAGAGLGRTDFGWLSGATLIYMAATVLGQAGLALTSGGPTRRWSQSPGLGTSGHRDQMLGWAAGFTTLVAVTLLPGSIPQRVELGFLAGSVVAGAVLAALLLARLRRWPAAAGPDRVDGAAAPATGSH